MEGVGDRSNVVRTKHADYSVEKDHCQVLTWLTPNLIKRKGMALYIDVRVDGYWSTSLPNTRGLRGAKHGPTVEQKRTFRQLQGAEDLAESTVSNLLQAVVRFVVAGPGPEAHSDEDTENLLHFQPINSGEEVASLANGVLVVIINIVAPRALRVSSPSDPQSRHNTDPMRPEALAERFMDHVIEVLDGDDIDADVLVSGVGAIRVNHRGLSWMLHPGREEWDWGKTTLMLEAKKLEEWLEGLKTGKHTLEGGE